MDSRVEKKGGVFLHVNREFIITEELQCDLGLKVI